MQCKALWAVVGAPLWPLNSTQPSLLLPVPRIHGGGRGVWDSKEAEACGPQTSFPLWGAQVASFVDH